MSPGKKEVPDALRSSLLTNSRSQGVAEGNLLISDS